MKRKIYLLLIFISLFIMSFDCKHIYIRFYNPQPEGVKDCNAFNKKFQGSYRFINRNYTDIIIFDSSFRQIDSNYLQINEKNIVRIKNTFVKFHKHIIDTSKSIRINNSKLVILENDSDTTFLNYELIGDSIFTKVNEENDTVFEISTKDVLRYYKKSYFLNFKKEGRWEVNRIFFNKQNELIFASLSDTTDLALLSKYTSVKEIMTPNKDFKLETDGYLANPTKKEFTYFIKKGGFGKYEKYKKIRSIPLQ